MFGLLIPARPIQPSPHETLSETQYAFTIPPAPSFSHLAVFLLPGHTLPPEALAAIYIKIPGDRAATANGFRLLGALANDKQSAVFRIAGAAQTQAQAQVDTDTGVREEIMLDDATGEAVAAPAGGADIVVGVSVEPAQQVHAQLQSLRAAQAATPGAAAGQLVRANEMPAPGALKEAAKRIGLNAFNFLSGFAAGPPGREAVPLKSLQEWWAKFEKKVDMDVGFLMREGG